VISNLVANAAIHGSKPDIKVEVHDDGSSVLGR
jgi:hypothetical protein